MIVVHFVVHFSFVGFRQESSRDNNWLDIVQLSPPHYWLPLWLTMSSEAHQPLVEVMEVLEVVEVVEVEVL